MVNLLVAVGFAGRAYIGWALTASVVGCLAACSAAGPAPFRLQPASSTWITFEGMCDASGAVALSAERFAIADDEDNVLRIYNTKAGGAPIGSYDVSAALELFPKPRKSPNKSPKPPEELDIEAATRIGSTAYWLTSHGRNSKAKSKPARLHFFATTLDDTKGLLQVKHQPYSGLLEALNADARFKPFALDKAAELAPKTPGGLNIEGMTARAGGGVWIGLRNPLINGRALIFSLNNPEAVVQGAAPEFGDPMLLDLAGRGIRALSSWRGHYLLVAGVINGDAASQLYRWDDKTNAVTPLYTFDVGQFNPEAFHTPEDSNTILIISDDGTREIDGMECKDLPDNNRKRFRAWSFQ